MNMDSATRTSPLGSTSIQRGWSRLRANALTLRPSAATGVCPSDQPLAVGILSVGIAPCGFAAGISGLLPQAGSCVPCLSRRNWSAVPPTTATAREKTAEKLNPLSPGKLLVPILRRQMRHVLHDRIALQTLGAALSAKSAVLHATK